VYITGEQDGGTVRSQNDLYADVVRCYSLASSLLVKECGCECIVSVDRLMTMLIRILLSQCTKWWKVVGSE
jgi:hypothetical protein